MVQTEFPLDNGYRVTLADEHAREDEKIVSDSFAVFNRLYAADDYIPLNLFVRDDLRAIKGGLLGAPSTSCGWAKNCAARVTELA